MLKLHKKRERQGSGERQYVSVEIFAEYLTKLLNDSIMQIYFIGRSSAMIIYSAVMNTAMVMYGMYNGFGLLCL